jgi:integrase/recombinase XerD
VPKTQVRTLSPDEVQKLLDAIRPNTAIGARNHAMLLLMLDSGPRVSEVISLKLSNLNLQDREARIMGKGRKERSIPFGQTTAQALLRHVTAFRPRPGS